MVCGIENGFSLKSQFYETTDHEIIAVFYPQKHHQSYPATMHGGMSAAILDEVIGRAVMAVYGQNAFGLTAELKIRYRKAVPMEVELKAIGRIIRDRGRIFEGTGELLLPDGEAAVTAKGKYMKQELEKITDKSFLQNEWFSPDEDVPEEITL